MTKEDFIAWTNNPQTREIMSHLQDEINLRCESWQAGSFRHDATESIENSAYCQALTSVINIQHVEVAD